MKELTARAGAAGHVEHFTDTTEQTRVVHGGGG